MLPATPIRDVLTRLEPCLVVEDDTIIILDIEHTLRQFGLSEVYTASSLAKAEALRELTEIRFALLDYELGQLATSLPLAQALADRGIPLVFLTAYGADVDLSASLAHVPVLSKPFTTAMLAKTLMEVAGASEAAKPPRLCG